MVKDLFRGFGYTLGKIIAFIFIGLVIATLISKIDSDFDISKVPFKQLIMKSLFVESYAQTNINPTTTKFYWSAKNLSNGNTDTANFDYNVGSEFQVGPAREQYELLRQGALLNYQATNGNYTATITFAWATDTINMTNTPTMYCNSWATDISNNSCSVGTIRKSRKNNRDIVYTTVTYNWSSASGYVELYADYTRTTFQPYFTYFSYTIDNFVFNPDFSSQIVDQNNTIINQNNEINNNIENINDTLTDTTITGDSIGSKFADIYLISDTPITDLLTMPLHLLQKIYNSIQTECSPYTLPFDFGFSSLNGYTLSLPCLNLGHENRLGRVVWGYIDDLCCIFMIYNIFKMVIYFYDSWTSLKDNFDWLIDPSTRGLPY